MLVLKEENIESSTIFLSYKILKLLKKEKNSEISIYNFYEKCSKCGIDNYSQTISVLCFLYSIDVIDFKEPYICLK